METCNVPPREGAKEYFTVTAFKKLATGKTETLMQERFETLEAAKAVYEAWERPTRIRARCIVSLTQEWQEPGSRFLIHRLFKDLKVYREV